MQAQVVDRAGLASIASAVGALAEAEGLPAHRRAVEIRFETSSPRGSTGTGAKQPPFGGSARP
jgi:hypothetical protein